MSSRAENYRKIAEALRFNAGNRRGTGKKDVPTNGAILAVDALVALKSAIAELHEPRHPGAIVSHRAELYARIAEAMHCSHESPMVRCERHREGLAALKELAEDEMKQVTISEDRELSKLLEKMGC